MTILRWIGLMLGFLLLAAATAARAQDASPHAIDIPPWFVDTFLDFNEDVAEATREGKRLMVYFGQDGCPYCTLLMKTNFSQRQIVDKTRKHFVAVALNIWGDRETKWTDGGVMSEKALARRLDVQFTPTLLFFDEQKKVAVRLNGYPPHRFEAVLDYVAAKLEHREPLAGYLGRHARDRRAAAAGISRRRRERRRSRRLAAGPVGEKGQCSPLVIPPRIPRPSGPAR